jgi:hypothetical protein
MGRPPMRYSPGKQLSSPRTANTHQRASNRDDEAWLAWARAAVQRDPTKAAMIKAVTSMLAGLKRSEAIASATEPGSTGHVQPRRKIL